MATSASASKLPFRSQDASGPSARAARGRPDTRLVELWALLDRLSDRTIPPTDPSGIRRLRHLLRSATSPPGPGISRPRDPFAEGLEILDAVLDSPLDLDVSVFRRIQDAFERPRPGGRISGTLSSEMADLASQSRAMDRLMQQQAEGLRPPHRAFSTVRARHSSETVPSSGAEASDSTESASPSIRVVRGLHVLQGGHHFLLPIDKVERALAVEIDELPTVHGRVVVQHAGDLCDVVRLADFLGLVARGDSSPKTIVAISEPHARVCLAVDKVVGAVEATVTPIETILPNVTTLAGVATLESGALALVPDLSRFAGAVESGSTERH